MGSTYVIGDVHGCFDTLLALWPKLGFDLNRDRLWLVGDLVNRGPKNLEVLRWARDLDRRLGDRLRVVLGNHDLHFVARLEGYGKARPKDTLEDVLAAPDRDDLGAWLASQPLLHREGDTLLVHAGLPPSWTPEDAEERARRLEAMLRDQQTRRPLIERSRARDRQARWRDPRADLAAFIGLRTCTVDGEPCKWKGPPEAAPEGCLPWFEVPGRASAGATVVFGHWGALGLHLAPRVIALDSGCVWGHRLSAIRLEDRTVFQQPTCENPTVRKPP